MLSSLFQLGLLVTLTGIFFCFFLIYSTAQLSTVPFAAQYVSGDKVSGVYMTVSFYVVMKLTLVLPHGIRK